MMRWIIILTIVQIQTRVLHSHPYTFNCDIDSPCGCSLRPVSITRIVGGQNAWANTWSWAVSLQVAGVSLCGGSLISDRWVVTAAHCVDTVLASQITVFAGSSQRWTGISSIGSHLVVHPDYDRSNYENDIALLQIRDPFNVSRQEFAAICMMDVNVSTLADEEWPPSGSYLAAVGWGNIFASGTLANTLQQVALEAIPYNHSFCSSIIFNETVQFCAGQHGGGRDTCQGDSGGPLMLFTDSLQWVLTGITSYGRGCASPLYAGVYTRVAFYQDWIRTVTNNTYTIANSSNPIDWNSSLIMSNNSITAAAITMTIPNANSHLFVVILILLVWHSLRKL